MIVVTWLVGNTFRVASFAKSSLRTVSSFQSLTIQICDYIYSEGYQVKKIIDAAQEFLNDECY